MGKAKEVAYGLRSEFDPLDGASVSLGPDQGEYNIKAALVRGNGAIATSDPELQVLLDGHHALERLATVPKGAARTTLARASSGNTEAASEQGGEE
jgi:hypothetical protein